MHIGFVTPESPLDGAGGGIASYLRTILPALVQAGHRVSLFTGAKETGIYRRDGGSLTVYRLRLPGLHWYLARLPLAARTVALPLRQVEWSTRFYQVISQAARCDPPDVLEATEVGGLFLHHIAPLVIRLHGSEYVFRRHTGQPITLSARLNHQMEMRICRRAAGLTSPSSHQARLAAAELGWPATRIQAIPNPLSPEILDAAAMMTESDIARRGSDQPIVLYTGRLAPVKGTEVLLAAIPHVLEACPQARFVLIGPWQMPGPPEDWGLIEGSHRIFGERVRWLGPLPWSDLIDWYRQATLFVMPSYYETFGLSVAEAMAFGLPVVASRAGALPELIEHGVTGLLTPSGQVEGLAQSMVGLLDDPDLRQRLALAARAHVLTRYTPSALALRMCAFYETIR